MPEWHQADSCSGHVRAPKSTKKIFVDATARFSCDSSRFNFNESVVFLETDKVPSFYREAFKYYNKAFVSTKDDFEKSIMSQPLWGNKFITHCIRCRKNVLFLRNWIRGGIRKVGDLKFKRGILDETFIFQKITCKMNLYTEIMLVKNALIPYQQSIIQGSNDTSVFTKVKLLKSKDIYNTLKNQLTCNANMISISNYLIPFFAIGMLRFLHLRKK